MSYRCCGLGIGKIVELCSISSRPHGAPITLWLTGASPWVVSVWWEKQGLGRVGAPNLQPAPLRSTLPRFIATDGSSHTLFTWPGLGPRVPSEGGSFAL